MRNEFVDPYSIAQLGAVEQVIASGLVALGSHSAVLGAEACDLEMDD